MRKEKNHQKPSADQLQAELHREQYKARYRTVLSSTIYTLITVAGAAILAATLWLPMLHIYGSNMSPALSDGQIVVCVATERPEPGDVVAFYYNNKLLVKRVIAGPGDLVDFDEDGTVYVNDIRLDEPYVAEKALGECDIDLPCLVPEGAFFVMGDSRKTSVDSRSTIVGCVESEQIVGRILLRIWPLAELGFIG